ncbi:MAG: PAS domain S-box protein [Chloroflexi bacterium]|nr:PAS domain S-box protein [Chloroflexota bacterium]
MNQQAESYLVLLLCSAAITLLLSAYAWRHRRDAPGAHVFALTTISVTLWPVAAALETLSPDLPTKVFWLNVQYLCIVTIPLGWALTSLEYATDGQWLTRRRVLLLSVLPVTTLLLAWSNDPHGLIRYDVFLDTSGPAPTVHQEYGPWFWLNATYSYVLLLAGGSMLAKTMERVPKLYWGQPLSLLAGMLSPLVWNLGYVLGINSGLGFDMSPVVLGVGAAIFGWGLFRYRLFEVMPVAHDKVIEAISDGVMVVDSRGRIVEINPAAQQILGCSSTRVMDRPFVDVLGHIPALIQLFENPNPPYTVLVQGTGAEQTYCAARVSPLTGGPDKVIGNLFVLRDFTRRKKAEDALKFSDQRFHELANSLPETVFEVDASGRITFVNHPGMRQFGYSLEEVQRGLNLLQMVAAQDRQRAKLDMERAIQTRQTAGGQEYLAIRKDGSTFPGVVSTSLVFRDGVPAGFRGLVVDVTARKQAEIERERLLNEVETWASQLDAVVSAIPVGLVIFDSDGNVIRMNDYGARLMAGATPQDRVPFHERITQLRLETTEGEPIPAWDSPPARALRGETVVDVVAMVHLAGEEAACASISAAPIRASSGRIVAAVATFADVTQLLELQQEREDITRAISHDLRGPLTVILGHAQIVDQQIRRSDTQRSLASTEAIVFAATQMNAMIHDLVDSIRIESRQLEVAAIPVDLPQLAADMKARLSRVLEIERIRIEQPQAIPQVAGDPDRLERILMNLITNALKYSDPDTEVVVRFSRDRNDVIGSVSDHGDGIASEEIPHLFTRFGKPRMHRQRTDSLGLGLYITKGLVEAHGGRVWVESQLGVGSTFFFSIPIAGPQHS